MKLYSKTDDHTIYEGNMLDMLEEIEPNSIDSIVTDPPYELGFMGKGWDKSGIAFQPDTWKKCLEVLKPGGYLLAFGGSRTYHRIACAIEDAGFEIRDCLMFLYGTGFPKSMNISKAIEAKEKYGKTNTVAKRMVEQSSDGKEYKIKQTNNGAMGEVRETTRKEYTPQSELAKRWQGWGTTLKPAYEPIIVARKPFKGSLVDNVLEYGVGGINIDECRVGDEERFNSPATAKKGTFNNSFNSNYNDQTVTGRFPANVIHDGSEGATTGMSNPGYFYCAKASRRDRDEGLDEFEERQKYYCDGRPNSLEIFGSTDGGRKPLKNIHPTVKPTALMQYLIRLVTPRGGG